jgi:hypothetical protein
MNDSRGCLTCGDLARAMILVLVVVGVAALAWLDRNDGGLRAWRSPQAVLAAAGLIIGFVIVSYQLKRQHWNTLDDNRRMAQDRLKVELYNTIAERIEATAVPLRNLAVFPTAFVGELVLRNSAAPDRESAPPSKNYPKLDTAQREAERTITALLSILETYAIAMPEFATFRSRLDESRRTMHVAVNDFQELAWQFAGSENVGVIRWPPTEDDLRILNGLANSAASSAEELKKIVSELCGAAQKYHLGNLFADNVSPLDARTGVQRGSPGTRSRGGDKTAG